MHLKQNKKTNKPKPPKPEYRLFLIQKKKKGGRKTEEKYYARKCNLISYNTEQKHKYYHQIRALVPLILYSGNSSRHVPGVRQEVKLNC